MVDYDATRSCHPHYAPRPEFGRRFASKQPGPTAAPNVADRERIQMAGMTMTNHQLLDAPDAVPVLDVRNLMVHFDLQDGRRVQAVDDLSFVLESGKTLGIVGESGSGKTTVVRAVLRIVDAPGRIGGGQIFFRGDDLLSLSDSA